jgi:hypothetical protein
MGVAFQGKQKDRFETLKREQFPSLAAGFASQLGINGCPYAEVFPRLPGGEDLIKIVKGGSSNVR